MSIFRISLLILFFLNLSSFSQDNTPKIAVFEIDAKRDVDTSLTNDLSSSLLKELQSINDYRFDDTLIRKSGCFSDENGCLANTAEKRGANFLITGFVGKINSAFYMIHLKMVDVKTKETLRSISINYNGTFQELDNTVVKKAALEVCGIKSKDSDNTGAVGQFSISKNEIHNKKRNQIIRRVIFGSLTLGFTAAGIYTNNEISKLEEEYHSSDHSNQVVYDKTWKDIKNYKVRRNAFYGAAIGSATLFLISIPF